MKYTLDSFLNLLEDRLDELESSNDIMNSTAILASEFTEDELQKFDSVKDEAIALTDTDEEAEEYMYNRLFDLGYNDDEITGIFDYLGV